MPLQLLELAVVIPRMFYKIFITRTPRGARFHVTAGDLVTDVKFADRSRRIECSSDDQSRNGLSSSDSHLHYRHHLLHHRSSHSSVYHSLLWYRLPRLQVQGQSRRFVEIRNNLLISSACSSCSSTIDPTSHEDKPGRSPATESPSDSSSSKHSNYPSSSSDKRSSSQLSWHHSSSVRCTPRSKWITAIVRSQASSISVKLAKSLREMVVMS